MPCSVKPCITYTYLRTIQAVVRDSAVPEARGHASAAYTKQSTDERHAAKQIHPNCSVSEGHLTKHIVLQVAFTD